MKAYGKLFKKHQMEAADCLRRLRGQIWQGSILGGDLPELKHFKHDIILFSEKSKLVQS